VEDSHFFISSPRKCGYYLNDCCSFRRLGLHSAKDHISMDIDRLKSLYQDNATARLILDEAARRQRSQSETKVDRIISLLAAQGHEISRGDIIGAFRSLEDLGAGQFMTGRRGLPSRFVWSVGMVSVGKAAAGEPQDIEEIPAEELEEAASSDVLVHSFHLRTNLQITLELPADLSGAEADRLANFVKTLPIESEL
jgi:hypothetical protein